MTIHYWRLVRREDVSGVSGTGVPAVAIEHPTGEFVIYWRGNTEPGKETLPGMQHHPNLDNAQRVHCHGGASEWVKAEEEVEQHWVISTIKKVMSEYTTAVHKNRMRLLAYIPPQEHGTKAQ